jgi:hypothetical protein
MRVNLTTRPSRPSAARAGTVPLTLTIRPACGLPGDYERPMDGAALLRLLRQQTDLPDTSSKFLRRSSASRSTRDCWVWN